MNSNRQRRAEIKARRLERADRLMRLQAQDPRRLHDRDAWSGDAGEPGVVLADTELLERFNNTYGPLPDYYLDRRFVCRDCGSEEVWTAKQQKWWYEIVGASIDSDAVRCRACRTSRREALRQGGSAGADMLGETSRRLRALAHEVPTPEARAEIERVLDGKWWGLRAVAIRTLGQWGGECDLARLRAIVDAADDRRGSWVLLGASAAVEALKSGLRHPDDDAWAIRAYLRTRQGASPLSPPFHLWSEFLSGIAPERMRSVFAEEIAGDDLDRLQRLVLLMRDAGTVPTGEIRERLCLHAHPDVRKAARDLSP